MRNGCARGWGRCLVAAAVAVGLGGAVAGRAGAQSDLLNRSRQLDDIAAQKVEGEVRTALTTAQRYGASQPAVAADQLRKALATLEADNVLPADRRADLTRQVRTYLKVVDTRADAANRDPARRPPAASGDDRRPPATTDGDAIRRRIDDINELNRSGRTVEAERQAELFARQYPDSPAAQALARNASMNARLAAARTTLGDMDRRQAALNRDIERGATPPRGDIEFSPDFKAKSDLRLKETRLSKEEQELLKRLNSPVDVNLGDTTFEKAADYLATLAGKPLIIEKSALEEPGVTIESNSPVKLTYRTMALRTVLRKFLGEYGLTYIIKDEAIYVTTAKRAREMMVTRVYYLGDLVAGVGTFGGGATWGPVIAREQMLENAKFITQLITSSIDPDSWSERGGGGSVTFHEPTMSLVIRQSAEVHAMIKGSMGGGLPK